MSCITVRKHKCKGVLQFLRWDFHPFHPPFRAEIQMGLGLALTFLVPWKPTRGELESKRNCFDRCLKQLRVQDLSKVQSSQSSVRSPTYKDTGNVSKRLY